MGHTLDRGPLDYMRWEKELENSIVNIHQLKLYRPMSASEEERIRGIIERHPMRITPYYASLINWNDPNDPIGKMAVPSNRELNLTGSYDTSGEAENTVMPGLQHKYGQTALILATNRCSVYCRHCFRKRLVGLPKKEILRRFEAAARYIEMKTEINNVLISGGDPLILATTVIARFLKRLSAIKHLDFIRIGSRVPVTFPQRILYDQSLLRLLRRYAKQEPRLYLVTQFNHPREITPASTEAISRVLRSGIIINNQTVLLKGVNHDPDILAELQRKLTRIGVNPYYVFQCRPVRRVKQGFQDSLYRGYLVVEAAKKKLNGHSKRFKYVMSHVSGKIEIVGITKHHFYFKYHEAKDPKNTGKLFKRKMNKKAGWLDDLKEHRSLSGMVQDTFQLFFKKSFPVTS